MEGIRIGPFGARVNASQRKTAIKSPYLNIISEITVLTARKRTARSLPTGNSASLIAVVNTNRHRRYLIFLRAAHSPSPLFALPSVCAQRIV